MKRLAALTSIILSLAGMHGVSATEIKAGSQHKKGITETETETKPVPEIQVVKAEWGGAEPQDIELLLKAVAVELLSHFPGRQLEPIMVSPSKEGPVVLYEKGPKNEYHVLLAARGENWAEYVYEFSHELFHILSNYDAHATTGHARHQWFEEMLCETVSLHTLKRFSLTWEDSPPHPAWSGYAPALHRFTQRALTEPHRQLPKDVTFDQWFRENGPMLIADPYLRKKYEVVSHLFLPLLEQNPDWRAVAYLNLDLPHTELSFYDYLAHWHRMTPDTYRSFVSRAMRIFNFKEPAPGDALLTATPLASPHTPAS